MYTQSQSINHRLSTSRKLLCLLGLLGLKVDHKIHPTEAVNALTAPEINPVDKLFKHERRHINPLRLEVGLQTLKRYEL